MDTVTNSIPTQCYICYIHFLTLVTRQRSTAIQNTTSELGRKCRIEYLNSRFTGYSMKLEKKIKFYKESFV